MKSFKSIIIALLIIPAALLAIGQAGSNLSFTGVQIAQVPDNALLDNLSLEYTIEAWINVTSIAGFQRIINRAGVFSFYIDPGTSKVSFINRNFPGTVVSSNAIAINTWYHVAVRRQNVLGTYTTAIFIDGVQSGTTSTSADFALGAGTTPLTLGNSLDPGWLYAIPLLGTLDEVRIWSIARTDAEIKTNRGVPLTGAELGLLAYYKLDEGIGQAFNDATVNNLDGGLGSDLLLADVNDAVWGVSNAPVGFNLLTLNGPGAYNIGTPMTLTWSVNPEVLLVNLLFSSDGGATWRILGFRVPNNGALNSFIPGIATANALFRVAHPDNAADFDNSDNLMTFNDVGPWRQTIIKEAEAGVLADKMYTSVDGQAFGCTFIFSKKENVGTCEIEFNIVNAGLYVIWCRARAVGGSANSYFWRMDGGPEKIWDTHKRDVWIWETLADRGNAPGYPWYEVNPVIFNFTAGNHKIKFRARETHCRLDQIRITNDLGVNITASPAAWLEVLKPKGGEQIVRGTSYEIKWRSFGAGSKVSIQFGDNRFFLNSNPMIAHNIPNNGSFMWQVPDQAYTDGFIRISSGEPGTCPVDQNHNEFLIVDPVIIVTAPNGGETWFAKTLQNITWINNAFNHNMNVSLSIDNGLTWTPLATNIVNIGTYPCTVPDVYSDKCLVKVASAVNGTIQDVSNHVFTIYPEIKVTSPNGGEDFPATTTQNVNWTTSAYTGKVNVYYSLDNGTTWNVLAVNQPGAGTVPWNVPATLSDFCLIKVAGTVGGLPTDQSDAVFSIIAKPVDYALCFDGINDYVEVPHSPSLNVSNNFTIEFWMKTSNPTQDWSRILEKGSWNEYYMGFYNSTGKLSGAIRCATAGGGAMKTVIGPSTTVLAVNTWYHVAATYNGTTAKIFINGNEESSKAATALPKNIINALILGAKKNAGVASNFYQGCLDELRIWNIARSKTEIVNNMHAQLVGNEAGLAAYYTFNEGAGQVVGDLTANANHGRLGNLPVADAADPNWVVSDKPTQVFIQTAQLSDEAPLEIAALPEAYSLSQNYPNPFNAGTTISFDIPDQNGEELEASIEIFDLKGRLINILWHGTVKAGHYQVYWNGTDLQGTMAASGIFFYRLRVGDFSETKRMVMLK